MLTSSTLKPRDSSNSNKGIQYTPGWVIVRAVARDLSGLGSVMRLRCAIDSSIIQVGMWRCIGYVVLRTLSNGISTQRLRDAKPILPCR